MSLEGPSNLNQPSIDPSRMMGAGAVKKVSGDSAPVGSGKSPEILGNGATVSGSGKPEAASGQAKLAMMANGIAPTNGFFKGKIEEKPSDELNVIEHPIIKRQLEVLLPEHSSPATTAAYQALEARASSASIASNEEISLGKEAIIPNAGIIDSKSLIEVLKLEAKANGIPIGINTKEATEGLIELFHGSTRG